MKAEEITSLQAIKEILKDKNITNDFILENKGLIYKAIKKVQVSIINSEFEEDFLQEGYLSFYDAMLKYDDSKGTKFSAFAYINVKNDLVNYIHCNANRMKKWSKLISLDKPTIANSDDFDQEECKLLNLIPSKINIENSYVFKEQYLENYKNKNEIFKELDKKLKKQDYKDIFTLLLEGKSQAEISRLMECSRENIRKKVNQIMNYIKEIANENNLAINY